MEYFRGNPRAFALNLAVNDGYGDCTCAKCRSMDARRDPIKRVGLRDRYVRFDNRVAEAVAAEFPGKILAFLAYGSMSRPPAVARLHPMLMPVLCVGGNTFQMWDDWARTGDRHMGVYFYHDDAWFILPKLDVRGVGAAASLPGGQRPGPPLLPGVLRDLSARRHGRLRGTGAALASRGSEDAILGEYYARFFGRAAAPMKDFYRAVEEGYTQWLAKAGQPYPYGSDMGSLADGKSIEQFAVLPPAQALEATSALEQALVAAKRDQLVSRRVELVKTLFEFAALGSRTYWAAQRLRDAASAGDAAAGQSLADARKAVDAGLALADYRFAVMEKPEIQAYENHPVTDTFYQDLTRGAVHAEILDAVDRGFGQVSAWLRTTRGPADAEGWWREQQRAEPRPVLRRLMEVAACDAAGRIPANLVRDPSFEQRGPAVRRGGIERHGPVAKARVQYLGRRRHAVSLRADFRGGPLRQLFAAIPRHAAGGHRRKFGRWRRRLPADVGVGETQRPAGPVLGPHRPAPARCSCPASCGPFLGSPASGSSFRCSTLPSRERRS